MRAGAGHAALARARIVIVAVARRRARLAARDPRVRADAGRAGIGGAGILIAAVARRRAGLAAGDRVVGAAARPLAAVDGARVAVVAEVLAVDVTVAVVVDPVAGLAHCAVDAEGRAVGHRRPVRGRHGDRLGEVRIAATGPRIRRQPDGDRRAGGHRRHDHLERIRRDHRRRDRTVVGGDDHGRVRHVGRKRAPVDLDTLGRHRTVVVHGDGVDDRRRDVDRGRVGSHGRLDREVPARTKATVQVILVVVGEGGGRRGCVERAVEIAGIGDHAVGHQHRDRHRKVEEVVGAAAEGRPVIGRDRADERRRVDRRAVRRVHALRKEAGLGGVIEDRREAQVGGRRVGPQLDRVALAVHRDLVLVLLGVPRGYLQERRPHVLDEAAVGRRVGVEAVAEVEVLGVMGEVRGGMRGIPDEVRRRRALVSHRVAAGDAVERRPANGAEVRVAGCPRRARAEHDQCRQAQTGRTKTPRVIRSVHDTPLPQESRPLVGVDLAGGQSKLRAGPDDPVSQRHEFAALSSGAARSRLRNI